MASNRECSEPSTPDLSTLTISQSTKDSSDSRSYLDIGRLSPTSQGRIKLLVQNIGKGEARIGLDVKGRPVTDYEEKVRPLNWDASNANVITTPKGDRQQKIASFLELVGYLKSNRNPSGVNLDAGGSKISLDKGKWYEEFSEFEKTKKILGTGNMAGDIIVLRDKGTNTEHALKTIMISVFRKEEILSWVDLNETGVPPQLFLFKIEDNKIQIHMEKLDNVVTLREIIENHMNTIRDTKLELVRPFSLCVFDGILSAVRTMHEKNWTHRDLHAGNILVQKKSDCSIKVRIIDFGLASRLDEKGGLEGFRTDIKESVRQLSALYAGQEFNSARDLDKKETWTTNLDEAANLYGLSESDREELFSLVDSTVKIVAPFETKKVQKTVQEKLAVIDLEKIMKEVIPILFPPSEVYQPVHHRGQSSKDSSKRKEADDDTLAKTRSEDAFIKELRVKMGIGETSAAIQKK